MILHVFPGPKSIQSGLLFLSLFAVFLLNPGKVLAQVGSATIKVEVPNTLTQGQVVRLPLLLTTSSQNIDGVQVEAQVSGVRISQPKIEVNNDLQLQILKEEATLKGFSFMVVPTQPLSPISFPQEIELATFSFIPEKTGTLILHFDPKTTLAPSSQNSRNILISPPDITLVIPTTQKQRQLAQDPAMPAVVSELQTDAKPSITTIIGALILLIGTILGMGIYYVKFLKKTPTSSDVTIAHEPSQQSKTSIQQ